MMNRSAPAEATGPGAATAASNAGEVVYYDGRFIEKSDVAVSPDDRGFLLGDGVYEVAAAYAGEFVALGRHLDRLRSSLGAIRIDESIADPLESVFQELIERNRLDSGRAMVYLQVTRGAARRTHAFPKPPVRPTVYAFAAPFPDLGDLDRGVGAISTSDIRWARCDIKSISLVANCLANQEAKDAGAFEALFVRDGLVLEGSHTNFFAVVGGELRTAPLSPVILPGITRELVINVARKHGIVVVEEALSASDLRSAEELFLTGTITEVVPITRIDGLPVADGTPGEITRRVAELYREIAHRGP